MPKRKRLRGEAILHPVRMRMVQAFAAGNRKLSIAELVELLGDVPQATVYRHVKVLVEAGLLAVIERRRVSGTLQAIYGVPDLDALSDRKNFEGASPDELARLFRTFLTQASANFDRYVLQPGADLVKDRVMFLDLPLYLTEDEVEAIRQRHLDLMKLRERGPAPGRTLRSVISIGFPLAAAPSPRKNKRKEKSS